MVSVVVSDMERAKEFYAEKLGLEVATDYRQEHYTVKIFPTSKIEKPPSEQSLLSGFLQDRGYNCLTVKIIDKER
jgi:catechol 2,3-dioxygenase-like lactoylglutathione lyase family enzyme